VCPFWSAWLLLLLMFLLHGHAFSPLARLGRRFWLSRAPKVERVPCGVGHAAVCRPADAHPVSLLLFA